MMNRNAAILGLWLASATLLSSASEIRRKLGSCDIAYYNAADTYTASNMVNYGHYLSNTEFCRSEEYYSKVFITPIVICSICAFMLLCFFGGMFGRMFYDGCKCRPPREDVDEFEKQKTLNSTMFYIMCFLVLILDQLVFVGNERVNKAVTTLDDSASAVKDITYDMYDGGLDLVNYVPTLLSQYNDAVASCPTADSIILQEMHNNITAYSNATSAYTDDILPVQTFFDDVAGNISKYGVLYRQAALYFIWALAIVFSCGLLVLKYKQFRYGMKQVMWFGVGTYSLYVVLCFPWTFLTSAMADLCMEPSYNAVKSMPIEDNLQNIGAYYSSCRGNCTLTVSIDIARRSVLQLNDSAVTLLSTDCAANSDLQTFRGTLTDVAQTLETVTTTMACGPIQEQWFAFMNNGICQQLYSGTFFIWGSQILTSLFLFVLIVCVSVTYQFYGEPKAPYPLRADKVVPDVVSSAETDRSAAEQGFGDMEVQMPALPLQNIGRVSSFHSDISDELNSSFF
jgi:hypothetical protein